MKDPITTAVEAERARALASLSRQPRRLDPAAARLAAFDALREDMSAALAYRLGGPEPESDGAIRVVGMTFDSMLSTLLGFRGERRGSSAQEMVSRGILTGDVPELLTGAGNRLLRQAYNSYSSGLLRFCERVETRDFRPVKAIQVDGDATLKELTEAGAFTQGYLKSSAETFAIETFGRIVGVSSTLLSDDDLAAFGSLSERLGRMAAEFVAGKVAAMLESTAVLGDGIAPFHSSHANLGSAAVLSETTLGALLALVRNQKGLAGQSIAVEPKALVVPPALELTARKLIAGITAGNAAPPLEVVVEPRLTSAAASSVVADPASVAPIAFTYGGGSDGPTFAVGQRQACAGLEARVSLDFGCGWFDHRGASKNAGQ
jgi:hypothetical protein